MLMSFSPDRTRWESPASSGRGAGCHAAGSTLGLSRHAVSAVRRPGLAAQEREHREDTPVVVLAVGQPELDEDRLHVPLDRP